MSWLSEEWDDFVTKIESIPPSVRSLLGKLESDAGSVLQNLTSTAAADIAKGPLTTAAYVQAATDVMAQLPADSGILIGDVFAMLNAEVSYILTPSPTATPAPTPTPSP